MIISYNSIVIEKSQPVIPGVRSTSDGIVFTYASYGANCCSIKIFKKNDTQPSIIIDLDGRYKTGEVFCCVISFYKDGSLNKTKVNISKLTKDLTDNYEYEIYLDGKFYADKYAHRVCGRNEFGKFSKNIRYGFELIQYDWTGEVIPVRPLEDNIIYMLHLRGYTKHRSSGVQYKGTFRGMIEKISYINNLGVNAVLFLPMYDFNEIMKLETAVGMPEGLSDNEADDSVKVNYWGYTTDSYYFSPKASYASRPWQCTSEFRDMIKCFHESGIEVFMDMHFPEDYELGIILDSLRYWVLEYHIDGFKINNSVPEQLIRSDSILGSVKLISNYWNRIDIRHQNRQAQCQLIWNAEKLKQLADCNDCFMINVRRYIKGDENQVKEFTSCFQNGSGGINNINYVADVNGFTLMDAVSYDQKHNNDNGENNCDGTDFNYSWNCGTEGVTRRKSVMFRRITQIKNALTLLVLSRGIPMILAGDEFGNTQFGNNNAYCQDNDISWLNWKLSLSNSEINDYFRQLLDLRKEIFLIKDISYHGLLAWSPDYHPYSRTLGIMLNEYKDSYYIAINMHAEEHLFELPRIMDNKQWVVIIATDTNGHSKEDNTSIQVGCDEITMRYYVPAKSITVFKRHRH